MSNSPDTSPWNNPKTAVSVVMAAASYSLNSRPLSIAESSKALRGELLITREIFAFNKLIEDNKSDPAIAPLRRRQAPHPSRMNEPSESIAYACSFEGPSISYLSLSLGKLIVADMLNVFGDRGNVDVPTIQIFRTNPNKREIDPLMHVVTDHQTELNMLHGIHNQLIEANARRAPATIDAILLSTWSEPDAPGQ